MSSTILAQSTYTDQWSEYNFFQWLHRIESAWRFARPQRQDRAAHHTFGRRIERLAGDILQSRGHVISYTSHRAHHDLWCDGCKVEVKGAHFANGRYQFNLRKSAAAIFLLACVGADHRVIAWFVIPGAAIGGRRNAAIWSADPAEYGGQWAPYLGAWELVDRAAERGVHPWQLPLGLLGFVY